MGGREGAPFGTQPERNGGLWATPDENRRRRPREFGRCVDPRRESGWPYEAFRRPRSADLWQTTGEQLADNLVIVRRSHLEDCRSAAQADVLASLEFLDGKVSFARFDDVLLVRVAGPSSEGSFDRQVPEDIAGPGHALWDMGWTADSGHGISNR